MDKSPFHAWINPGCHAWINPCHAWINPWWVWINPCHAWINKCIYKLETLMSLSNIKLETLILVIIIIIIVVYHIIYIEWTYYYRKWICTRLVTWPRSTFWPNKITKSILIVSFFKFSNSIQTMLFLSCKQGVVLILLYI